MKHPIQQMMENRRNGIKCGIPSYCSANELVLEAALRRAKAQDTAVLIEATANQVNQFGGYTGMLPKDFYQMVLKMAEEIGVPEHQIILAGDHLGPLTWQNLPEKEAMENSIELVYQYARAGFTKIHLDTSMKVADDPDGLLSTETIARRGAILYKSTMKGYEELRLRSRKPSALYLSSAVRFRSQAALKRLRTRSPLPVPTHSATPWRPTAVFGRKKGSRTA